MKEIKNFLYRASFYTVIVSMVFFLFARIMGINELSMSFVRYLTVFAFSLVISASEYIFTIKKISKILKYAIHYAVLCISFSVVFLSVKSSSGGAEFKASTVFASIVLFSFVYFTVIAICALVKKKSNKKSIADDYDKKKYTPRFKGE